MLHNYNCFLGCNKTIGIGKEKDEMEDEKRGDER